MKRKLSGRTSLGRQKEYSGQHHDLDKGLGLVWWAAVEAAHCAHTGWLATTRTRIGERRGRNIATVAVRPGTPAVGTANNLAFFARGPRYVLRRMEGFPGTVVPITDRCGSVVLLRGRAAARQMFTDNETFHRPDGVLDLPPGQAWSRMFEAVITANGADHTRRRKLLMPAVNRTAIAHYTDVFARTFAESRFGPDAERGVFDARAEFLRISKANMLRCLLGLEPTDELGELADVIVRLGGDALSPGVVAWKRDLSWSPYGRWLRRVALAYERLALLIEQRRAEAPRADALPILCHTTDESGDRLTTDEIVGELHGFFSAVRRSGSSPSTSSPALSPRISATAPSTVS